jgi:predicted RecB family nuclease
MCAAERALRICPDGHRYYKSSDCPVCPQCEKEKRAAEDFFAVLVAPAKRALQRKGISTPRQLAAHTEKEILQLHGMGPSSIPKLKAVLKQAGLSFKNK